MKRIKAGFALFSLLLILNPRAFADSLPPSANQIAQPLHPELEILAETVWVNVKNRQAVTKVLLVLKNPADSVVATGFRLPLTKKDTLVDFGVSRRTRSVNSGDAGSSSLRAALSDFAESSDSAFADSQASFVTLPPGETATILLVYQTALGGENHSRYVFPLKESFQTKGPIRSFAFLADVEEKERIMEVKTENYPIVVRGNGSKRQIYFYQNNLRPKTDIGFSYRAAPPKKEKEL
ncbi:MAG: hypothetical protein ACRECJ_08065 [Limisphaerales bacterium]